MFGRQMHSEERISLMTPTVNLYLIPVKNAVSRTTFVFGKKYRSFFYFSEKYTCHDLTPREHLNYDIQNQYLMLFCLHIATTVGYII